MPHAWLAVILRQRHRWSIHVHSLSTEPNAATQCVFALRLPMWCSTTELRQRHRRTVARWPQRGRQHTAPDHAWQEDVAARRECRSSAVSGQFRFPSWVQSTTWEPSPIRVVWSRPQRVRPVCHGDLESLARNWHATGAQISWLLARRKDHIGRPTRPSEIRGRAWRRFQSSVPNCVPTSRRSGDEAPGLRRGGWLRNAAACMVSLPTNSPDDTPSQRLASCALPAHPSTQSSSR